MSMYQYCLKKINALSLHGKIVLIYVVGIFIPLVIITGYLFFQSQSFISREIEANNTLIASQIRNGIQNKLTAAVNMCDQLAYDKDVLSFFLRPFEVDSESIFNYKNYIIKNIINSEIHNQSVVSSVVLYTNNYTIPESEKIFHDTEFLKNDYISQFDDKTVRNLLVCRQLPDNRYMFSYIKKITTATDKYIGYVKADIPADNLLFDLEVAEIPLYIVYRDEILYSEESEYNGVIYKNVKESAFNVGNSLFVNQYIPDQDIVVVCRFDMRDVQMASLPEYYIIFFLMLLTVCMLVLALFSIKYVLKKVYLVIDTLNTVTSEERFDIRLPVNGDDEIAKIENDINILICKIEKLVNEAVVRETSQKDAQLMALSYQINPHFMYNAIDLIRMKMELEGQVEVAELLTNFGKMLRYNMGNDYRESTIKSEIGHVTNYFNLQKMHYGEKVILNVSMADELSEIKILKFSLQPILENSLKHGIPDDRSIPFKIDVKVHGDSENIYIEILDNGNGINKEKLELLNYSFRYAKHRFLNMNNKTGSLGLKNINERLRLLYSPDSYIQLESEYGKWTKTIVKIPIGNTEN